MNRLQIQPQLSCFSNWKALAEQQGLSFEIFDLPGAGTPFAGLTDEAVTMCVDSGLVASLHGAFVDNNPASGDPEIRDVSRRRCEESCRMAVRLGANAIVLHGSCFPFLRGDYLFRWADCCAEYYLDLANRYHLTVCVENSMDVDPKPLRELMKRMQSPEVAVCLDIGHANYSRAPLSEWFGELDGWIRYLHLSDNTGLFDDHLPVGSGTVDWEQASALCRQAGTVERITLEVDSCENVLKSLAYMKEHKLFGME